MTPAKSYRDRLEPRPGFPIRRPTIDGEQPVVQKRQVLGMFGRGQGA
ncbi:MAG: hypothetical protein PGN16_04385 [Sphingomonas phyllosphaerae]